MLIKNTIGWNTPWLRQLIRWVAHELEYDWRKISAAHFCLAHRSAGRGKAYCGRHTVRVKMNPLNLYPLTSAYPRALPPVTYADSVELLIGVTAHEVAHLERWDRFARKWQAQGRRDTQLERDTELLARAALAAFRSRREELLAGWGDRGPGPLPPEVVHQLTCRRCGTVWRSARRLPDSRRRSCRACFGRWEDAAQAGEFLAYERVSGEAVEAASQGGQAGLPTGAI